MVFWRIKMLNFTVGPVQSSQSIREIGYEQVPYFRTPEFSEIMMENERLMKTFTKAEENARVVFLTGSGTASMEAAIMNSFTSEDKVLVVDGGSFGHRFIELCQIHDIPYTKITLELGKALKKGHLEEFDDKGYTGFVVNLHETSTGVYYDLELISEFCKRNHLFLIVDAISSFLADPIDMKKTGIDMLLIGSQKALACPPGISIMVMSKYAVDRIANREIKCMYLNLKNALKNGERGQTPFTPAVGILLQIHRRLKEIESAGGVETENAKIGELAKDFRARIQNLPFELVSESMSNAATPLHPTTANAYDIFNILKEEYGIWICPNSGVLADKIFRVGHIGALTKEDNTTLIKAFEDLVRRGIL